MSTAWDWSFPAEIIICDPQGMIVQMNRTAVENYAADLTGQNVFDHHEEPACSQLRGVVAGREPVLYTTEKAGLKKLVTIAPWYRNDHYAGFSLLVLDLPPHIPNIVKG